MGVNYYLKYVGEGLEERSDHKVEKVEEEQYIYNSDRETTFHIGKFSHGWKFIWNFEMFLVWKKTGDDRWNLVSKFWERVKKGSEKMNRLVEAEFVPEVKDDDILEVLVTPGYQIVSECGGVYTLSDIINIAFPSKRVADTLLDTYKNQKLNGPSWFEMYTRDFVVGSQLFASCAEFS